MTRLWTLLLPELRRIPSEDRAAALRRARDTALDVFELVGMAAGLLAVTALTRYAIPEDAAVSRIAAALLNFVVAIPLLVVLLGPFHLRRLRRGLRAQLRHGDARP